MLQSIVTNMYIIYIYILDRLLLLPHTYQHTTQMHRGILSLLYNGIIHFSLFLSTYTQHLSFPLADSSVLSPPPSPSLSLSLSLIVHIHIAI